jgi:hypothetical protein
MHTNFRTLFRVTVIVLSLGSLARAGVLTTDANAIPGWQGSIVMSGANLSATHTVTAEVDYAVYTRAQYLSSPALNAYLGHTPADPGSAGPNDFYVYTYQIFTNQGGDSNVTVLSIGLDYLHGAIPTNGNAIGHDGSPTVGAGPNFSLFIPGSDPRQNAKWQYSGTGLALNSNSDILIFTSPSPPQMYNATMNGTNTTADTGLQPRLPSPTPEPAAVVLAVVGGAGILAWRTRRRRHR